MELTIPTTHQVANALERGARAIAPCVALIVACTLLLMQLAYDLGFLLGRAVHQRNDQLSAIWRRLWVPDLEQTQLNPAPAPLPAVHPLAALASELDGMTTRQLQQLTGCRRRLAKRQLIAIAIAC
jgi:hypothetical protein